MRKEDSFVKIFMHKNLMDAVINGETFNVSNPLWSDCFVDILPNNHIKGQWCGVVGDKNSLEQSRIITLNFLLVETKININSEVIKNGFQKRSLEF